MTRLLALWRAWLAGRTHDWPETDPDIGTDDDGHAEPCGCGCDDCTALIERVRARIQDEWRRQAVAREDLADIEASWALPLARGRGQR